MGFISPQQIYDDPKLWLSVLHGFHQDLRPLMEKLFPDFSQKLKGIHCLECEGQSPFQVIDKTDLKLKLCTGYVGARGKVELLWLTDIARKETDGQ